MKKYDVVHQSFFSADQRMEAREGGQALPCYAMINHQQACAKIFRKHLTKP